MLSTKCSVQPFSDTSLARPAWALVLVRDGSTIPMERIQVDPFPDSRSRPLQAPTSRAHPKLSPPWGDVDGNLHRVTSWRQELPVSVPTGAQLLWWQAEVPARPPPSWGGGKDTVLALKPWEGQS